MADTPLTYEQIEEAAEYIKNASKTTARIAVITGAALGTLGSNITDAVNVPYDTIPHFPKGKQPVGQVIAGTIGDKPVVIMQGRYHFYDGYTIKEVTMFIRVLKLMEIEILIISNASGAINPDYKVGDVMMIKDHINLMGFSGQNPLVGPNDDKFGPRFPAMNKAYNKEFLKIANEILKEISFEGGVHEGVYGVVSGPGYETISENIFLKTCGIDAVGMTIVPEVIVAKHCGMGVFAFNIITEEGVLDLEGHKETNHEEMLAICGKRTEQLNQFLEKFLPALESYHRPSAVALAATDAAAAPSAEGESPDAAAALTAATAPTAEGEAPDAAAAHTPKAAGVGTCCKCPKNRKSKQIGTPATQGTQAPTAGEPAAEAPTADAPATEAPAVEAPPEETPAVEAPPEETPAAEAAEAPEAEAPAAEEAPTAE